jgi:hypothetical protein
MLLGYLGQLINIINPPRVTCGPKDRRAAAVADTLLDEWKNGDSGTALWKAGTPMKKLFNASGWDRLDATYQIEGHPNASAWTFRVKSTAKARFPVTQTWKVHI